MLLGGLMKKKKKTAYQNEEIKTVGTLETVQETETTCPEMEVDVNDNASNYINYERCENDKNVVLDAQNLSSIGRFLTVNTTVKNVCPNKQIAIGLKLYETTGGGKVIKGHKMFAIQHEHNCCADITLSNIHFVLPEEIAETDDKTNICSRRTFNLETTSHYIDLTHVS